MASAVHRHGVTAVFLTIDISFFAANLLKLPQGGWVSLFIALLLFTAMTTWKTGRRLVAERLTARRFRSRISSPRSPPPPTRVSGTAVFMTAQPRGTPPALVHNLRYNKILHEHVVVLTVTTAPVPYVAPKDQVSVRVVRARDLQRARAVRLHAGSSRARSAGHGARSGRRAGS